jgi:hypothetical protein
MNFERFNTHLQEAHVSSMMRRITAMMERYREHPGLIGRDKVLPMVRRSDKGLPRLGPWELEQSKSKRAYEDARRRGVSLAMVAKEFGVRPSNLYLWAKTRGLPRRLGEMVGNLKH